MRINNILTGLYKSKPAQKYMDRVMQEKTVVKNGKKEIISNYSILQKAFPPAFMCFIQLTQCGFLAQSKEMPKERKVPLIFNNIYSCIIALAIGAACGKHVNKLTKHLATRAKAIYGEGHKIINGIESGMPILKEALLFEYVGYVAAVPLGTQTANWLFKKGIIKHDNNKKA